MSLKNDGKASEKLFDGLYKVKPGIAWYQFVDTYRARSFVPDQPADRLLIYEGQAWLVEIKSTNDLARFPLKNIKKKQVGHGRYWRQAGAKEVFIIHHLIWNKFYFVPFAVIDQAFKEKRSSIKWDELAVWEEPFTFEFYRRLV